ncbi:hypothetical protein CIHG_05365 [Coccidioides immitis H538.4]|uniref:Uncharacterized protein n=1 Tax=Coccidioides immitis H538.4 TaxID=396776 RepID=A0A0J8RVV0_COCIT|nr:hypothetical protein CIHG_05365 [Coccidioides immitis H538.4]
MEDWQIKFISPDLQLHTLKVRWDWIPVDIFKPREIRHKDLIIDRQGENVAKKVQYWLRTMAYDKGFAMPVSKLNQKNQQGIGHSLHARLIIFPLGMEEGNLCQENVRPSLLRAPDDMEFNMSPEKGRSFLLTGIILIISHIFNKVIEFTPVFFDKVVKFTNINLSGRAIKFVHIAIEVVDVVGVITTIHKTSDRLGISINISPAVRLIDREGACVAAGTVGPH